MIRVCRQQPRPDLQTSCFFVQILQHSRGQDITARTMLFGLAVSFLLATAAFAQNALLTIPVTDGTGVVVPGARVSVTATATVVKKGACGCCGMEIYPDRNGNISALYRSATESVHRDIYLLASKDKGKT